MCLEPYEFVVMDEESSEKDERKYFDQYIKESILLYPEKKTQIENNIKSLRLDWIKRLQLKSLSPKC